MEDIKTNSLNKPEEKSNKDKTAKAKFTGEGDILTRATVGDARIYVARTTRLVRKLSLRHNLSHLALLLAATMKNEEGVGIKVTGDGPIQGITGEAQGGIARGYVGNPDVYLPPKNGHLDVGGAVGNGTISVTRYTAGAKPFTGTAELVDGEIADDLTRYLYTSEQTPSSVGLGVLVDETGDVQAAGELDKNVRNTPYVSSLIDMGFTPERIIQMLGKDMEVEILDSYPLHFGCRCSRERVEGVLETLPKKELKQLAEDEKTEITCPYCNAKYEFSQEEMQHLAQKAKK